MISSCISLCSRPFTPFMYLSALLYSASAQEIASPVYPESQRGLESGAIFWHLVDLLWIMLFALFYLV